MTGAVSTSVRLYAEPLALWQVRFPEGPFRGTMERNAAHLLRLERDRPPARVREFAHLAPKAPHHAGGLFGRRTIRRAPDEECRKRTPVQSRFR